MTTDTKPSKAKRFAGYLDTFQQRHPQVGLPIAVFRKYSDDQGGNLANLLAYWAFFSLFPLLLVGVTLMGLIGIGDTFKAILASFPLVGAGLSSEQGLSTSPVPLVIGIVTALWTGIAVFKTAQTAFDSVWEVPMTDRAGFVETLVRSLKAVVVLGLGFLVSTALSGVATGGKAIHVTLPIVLRILVGLFTIALDVLGFCLAYVFLTKRQLSFRDVLPGAIGGGVLYFALQLGGTALVSHGAQGHTGAIGSVATVLGLLWWFSLQAQVVLLGAELNVVLVDRLWPRGLVDPPETEADERAYRAYAAERTYQPDQTVETTFGE